MLLPIGAGESYDEGYYALNDRDVVVEQVAAIAPEGVSAEPLLRVPAPDATYIGNIASTSSTSPARQRSRSRLGR